MTRRILEAIAAQRLPPGAVVPGDVAIARHLQVSTTTVRRGKAHVLAMGAVHIGDRGRHVVSDDSPIVRAARKGSAGPSATAER